MAEYEMMDRVERAVEIGDKGIQALKKIEAVNAADARLATMIQPKDIMDQAERAVEIGDKGIQALKKIEAVNAADARLATMIQPKDIMDQAERAVEIGDKGIQALKKIEAVNAADARLATMIQPKPGKREVIETMYEKMPTTANRLDENVGRFVDKSGEIIVTCLDAAFEKIKKELKTDHGSKVRAGRFYGCSIIYAGTKSCIVVDKEKPELFYLTPESVLLSRYVEKKFFPLRGKNYYYYELVFKDGSESYVRVSKKHRQNLERCGLQDTAASIFKELLPGEICEDSDA